MDLQLAEDVAVVVGGARGIGHAIAAAFAAEQARVAIIDRDAETSRVAEELSRSLGVACLGLSADVSDYIAMEDCRRQILARFGRCDHIVYAAAIGSGKFGFPFWNLQPDDWPRVLNVNLVGAVNVAHAFAPHLAEMRQGTLLFIASVAAQIGSQTDPPYSASKAGLINFMQCAARDSRLQRAQQCDLPWHGRNRVEQIGMGRLE